MFGINRSVKALFSFFRSALDPIVSKLKTKEGRDAATQALTSVINLGEHAVDIVRAVAGVAGYKNEHFEAALAGAQKYGLKIEEALAEPDEFARIGKLIRIEGEGLRSYIANTILPKAQHGIQIGDQFISTVEELNFVPKAILEAAAHNAHLALKVAGEIVKPLPVANSIQT